jgi:hypothetical protein
MYAFPLKGILPDRHVREKLSAPASRGPVDTATVRRDLYPVRAPGAKAPDLIELTQEAVSSKPCIRITSSPV